MSYDDPKTAYVRAHAPTILGAIVSARIIATRDFLSDWEYVNKAEELAAALYDRIQRQSHGSGDGS